MEYFGKSNTSSRRSSSVYDDFHRDRLSRRRNEIIHNPDYSASDWDSSRSSYSRNYGNNYRNRNYSTSSYGNSWGYWGRSCCSLSGGSYMLLVLGLSYIGKRFFGIGPYQVLFWVNMLTGRRIGWFAPFRGWGQGMYDHVNRRAAHYGYRPAGMRR